MNTINVSKYIDEIERKINLLNISLVFNEQKLTLSDIFKKYTSEDINTNEVIELHSFIKKENFNIEIVSMLTEFDDFPEKLKLKASKLVIAKNTQNNDFMWKFSKHKNITNWWLLSDGTMIAENESEKYGISYTSVKINKVIIHKECMLWKDFAKTYLNKTK